MATTASGVKPGAPALQRVEQLFHQQIETGLHPGAALAVYQRGRLVLDLQGGWADNQKGQPVAANTMFVMFSSTKPMAATCIHILWERGKLAWDDPVAKHWPEFGKNGKAGVTIRHILTHTAGFPDTPQELTPDRYSNWDAVMQAMENASLVFEPGSRIHYHPRNYGWVIAELTRRIDGRPISRFLREEVTGPLGMADTYIGLPAEHENRVARIHAMHDCDRAEPVVTFNRPDVHRSVVPAAGGIAAARDLARYYAMLEQGGQLDGARVLKAETIAEATRQHVAGVDHSSGLNVKRGLGVLLGDPRMGSSSVKTFGHGGAGTSVGWADPESGLAFAYITNGFRANPTNNPRLAAMSQAVRAACQ